MRDPVWIYSFGPLPEPSPGPEATSTAPQDCPPGARPAHGNRAGEQTEWAHLSHTTHLMVLLLVVVVLVVVLVEEAAATQVVLPLLVGVRQDLVRLLWAM